MILVIDNYDSFVHNLARYVRELGGETRIVRNDQLTIAECRSMMPYGIVLSPGPGRPATAGVCMEIIAAFTDIPILGVCLGHQCIAEVYGGHTVSSREVVHGRAGAVYHDGTGVFKSVNSPLEAGRYHSLSVNVDECDSLVVQARAEDGEIMAVRHIEHPHHGVQFHPESVLTVHGKQLIQNFLDIVKVPCP